MSSLCRTIRRSRSRLAWPASKWREIHLIAAAWRTAKEDRIKARKEGQQLPVRKFMPYVYYLIQKWARAEQQRRLQNAKPVRGVTRRVKA